MFRKWQPMLLPEWQLRCLELPGRERRISDPPYKSIEQAADRSLQDVLNLIAGEPHVALFGHSMGAVLAFEIARRLEAADRPPSFLIASGSAGPKIRRSTSSAGLDDDEFLARVTELAGYEDAKLKIPEVRDLVLPTLRADVDMRERYVWDGQGSLACPIIVIRGADDTVVSRADAAAWQEASAAQISSCEPAGGHMYLLSDPMAVISVLKSRRPSCAQI
jgi:surfactin synthase thioesterase subunit